MKISHLSNFLNHLHVHLITRTLNLLIRDPPHTLLNQIIRKHFWKNTNHKHSRPGRIGLRKTFGIKIGSPSTLITFSRELRKFKNSWGLHYMYIDWGAKKLQFFYLRTLSTTMMARTAPPILYAALLRLNWFSNVALNSLYQTRSQNVARKYKYTDRGINF